MAYWASALAFSSIALTPLQWLQVAQYELMLFAGFWFIIGMVDEMAMDLAWLGLMLRGKARAPRIGAVPAGHDLRGIAAVFIPAWREADVIGTTIGHALAAWPHAQLRLYVGCYRNDPTTISAAMTAARGDRRVRLVIHDRDGPTTKADCLNRLYGALAEDELRGGEQARSIVLHDAEDMVHPSALAVLDAALDDADFVQLPVRPELMAQSRWVAGHYADEFAEAHAKSMVVRDALRAAMPAAGVGCALRREVLAELADDRKAELEFFDGLVHGRRAGPFAAECLTEDYELGWRVARRGRSSRFLRLRDEAGQLIATRSCFPPTIDQAVRQKSRWVHGIAFQGWDRLGWSGSWVDLWMALRDRRGPLVAIILFVAYVLVVVGAVLQVAAAAHLVAPAVIPPELRLVIVLCLVGLAWRVAFRLLFTAREYGLREGLRAVLRIPLANLIAIIAGRRALAAYVGTLAGSAVHWEKTTHSHHPAADAQPVALGGATVSRAGA